MGLLIAHPLAVAGVVVVGGFAIGACITRWEIRAQMRRRRHGGFLIGRDR